MSVLFGLVAAVAAKLAPRDVEITRLQAEIDALKRQRDEARAQCQILEDEITIERRWRRHWQSLVESPSQQMQAQAQLQQIMAMQAAAQNQVAQFQNIGMLGAQNLNLGYEWCNCVPARHDMFVKA